MISRKMLAITVAIMLATVAVAGVAYAAFSASYQNTGNSVEENHAKIYVSGGKAIFDKDVTYDSTTTINDGSAVTTYVFSNDMAVTNKKAVLSTDDLEIVVDSTDDDAQYTLVVTLSASLTALGDKANYKIDLTNTSTNAVLSATANSGTTFTFEDKITEGTYSMSVYVLLADDFVSFSEEQLIADMTSGTVTFTATSVAA